MAVRSESTNPVTAVNLALVFDTVPGASPATESLRLALMAVGALHQSYLMKRKGPSQPADDMMELAIQLRNAATQNLHTAMQNSQDTCSDSALGAAVTLALIDIFAGGRDWKPNFQDAKTLINARGGPVSIVSSNVPVPAAFAAGLSISPARLLLEILTVYDTFSCITSGEEPVLLSPGKCDWWFKDSKIGYHALSVEHVFGLSRSMIPLIAKVFTFVMRTNLIPHTISETGPREDASDTEKRVFAEACELYSEVEAWTDVAPNLPQRVLNGNHVHQLAMQITLLRDVFRVSRLDPRVQQFSLNVLQTCYACAKEGSGVDLMWPTIISGCQVEAVNRQLVENTFNAFREQCCFEVETSLKLVREVWQRMDRNQPRADWRSLVEDCNYKILVL